MPRSLEDLVRGHYAAVEDERARASVLAHFGRAPLPTLPPMVSRQVARMHASMREFGYDPGGYWQTPVGAEGFECGYQPRTGGDPIFHTICELAGVEASREEVVDALSAVLERHRVVGADRLQQLPPAIERIATALADGRRVVFDDTVGTVRIQGPTLPPNWDDVIPMRD